ncbi:MAG: hypothetical protein H6Q77_1132 [Gemmatimonadetes bacterium]|nr:hypothetical protein [Gemmatimonadota bacterium]
MRPAVLLLALILPVPLMAQQRIDRRMAVSSTASIRINDLVGMVRLVGWDRDSLVVVGELPARAGQLYFGGSTDAAKVGLEGTDTGSVVTSATLEVRVPKHARVSVRGAVVSLDAGGLEGDLDFITTAGRLHVEGAPRTVTAETLDGNVEVAGPVASLRVRTAGGTVVLRGVRGDLTVTTVSGAILIGGARISRARLETVSGEIAWKGAIERGGTLDAQTHSGNIELRLPPTLGADLELSAPSGAITSEFTLKGKPSASGTLRTSIGDGGAAITARTFRGRISLLKQPEVDANPAAPGGISGTSR